MQSQQRAFSDTSRTDLAAYRGVRGTVFRGANNLRTLVSKTKVDNRDNLLHSGHRPDESESLDCQRRRRRVARFTAAPFKFLRSSLQLSAII